MNYALFPVSVCLSLFFFHNLQIELAHTWRHPGSTDTHSVKIILFFCSLFSTLLLFCFYPVSCLYMLSCTVCCHLCIHMQFILVFQSQRPIRQHMTKECDPGATADRDICGLVCSCTLRHQLLAARSDFLYYNSSKEGAVRWLPFICLLVLRTSQIVGSSV